MGMTKSRSRANGGQGFMSRTKKRFSAPVGVLKAGNRAKMVGESQQLWKRA